MSNKRLETRRSAFGDGALENNALSKGARALGCRGEEKEREHGCWGAGEKKKKGSMGAGVQGGGNRKGAWAQKGEGHVEESTDSLSN
jgi:hypothetical protein